MLYVGLTEEHRESASLFANVVGSQVLSQVVASNLTAKNKTTKPGWCRFLNLSVVFTALLLYLMRTCTCNHKNSEPYSL